MFGLDLLTVSSLLVMTAGNTMQCTVPSPPRITINPTTKPIEYVYSQSSAALTSKGSDTISPYAPGADTTTGGLRQDTPQTSIGVKWGVVTNQTLGLVCLYYDEVTVDIALNPKIYIAKEYSRSRKCKAAILEHERKHVTVDREVINKYAQLIGQSVKDAVDSVGALGPYKAEDLERVQKQLVEHVTNAAQTYNLQMDQEMRRRQGEVDSLEEYRRISDICED